MSKQLRINPEMDAEAAKNGLGHWSCVSPLGGIMWVRSDGCTYDYQSGRFSSFIDGCGDTVISTPYIIPALKECDAYLPIGKDWQQPETEADKLLKIAIGALNQFANDNDSTRAIKSDIENYLGGKDCNYPKDIADPVGDLQYQCAKEKMNDLIGSKQLTLVQKPFQYPCDGALYFTRKNHFQVFITESNDDVICGNGKGINGAWTTKEGELLVKGEIDGSDDFDLIMMVRE